MAVMGEHLDRGEQACILLQDRRVDGPVAMLRDDVLRFAGVKEFEVGFGVGLGLGAVARNIGVHPGDARLGLDADRRIDDLKLPLASSTSRKATPSQVRCASPIFSTANVVAAPRAPASPTTACA